MRAAPNLPTSVHVKLFEDVTNHDHLRVAKPPPPAQRGLAELERQQRLQQAVLRQRTNPAVPRYAQALGVRPQTAPSGRPTLLRGPPGATGHAAVSRPSQRVGGDHAARTVAAERAYLPVTKAPTKVPIDPYALSHGAAAAQKLNPRLGEVEKEMLHRQALLRRLMREPRHAAHGVAHPQSRPQSAHPQSRPQSAHPQSRPPSAPPSSRPFSAAPPSSSPKAQPAFVGSPDMYRHEKVLGKGAFGLVSLVRSVRTGEALTHPARCRLQPYVPEAAASPRVVQAASPCQALTSCRCALQVLTGELVAMKTIDRSKLYTQNLKKTVEHETP